MKKSRTKEKTENKNHKNRHDEDIWYDAFCKITFKD